MSVLSRTKVVVSPNPKPRPGEREVTMPVRNDPPRPVAVSPAELRATRLLVAITAATGLVCAIIAVVGFQVMVYIGRGGPPPPTVECDDDTLFCPEDQVCQSGHCRALPPETYCEAGDPCSAKGECTCAPPMRCDGNICKAPSRTDDPDNKVCENPKIQEALAQLDKECKGDLGRCAPAALDKFAMNYEGFDELISAFPETITLHFPTGKPPITRARSIWPPEKTKNYYVDSLRRSVTALRDARYVFIIARSSPHGDLRRNSLFAQQRSIHAKELLFAALELPTAERDRFSSKFREFILGPKRRLNRDFFAQRYSNHFITWSKSSHDLLLQLLRQETPNDRDAQWVDDTINQVVLVVPVSCELKAPLPGK